MLLFDGVLALHCCHNLNFQNEFWYLGDGDILWTMTSSEHFFSKWANFRGRFQRVTSCGHFLVTSRGHFCPREVLFLGEFSWTFFG